MLWALTDQGRPTPLDPEVETRYVLNDRAQKVSVMARRSWRSHFATCPNAADHRKPKEKSA